MGLLMTWMIFVIKEGVEKLGGDELHFGYLQHHVAKRGWLVKDEGWRVWNGGEIWSPYLPLQSWTVLV